MRNEDVLKNWYGLYENAWFPWQPLILFSRIRVGIQIQPYLGFYLSLSTKIGVKLNLKHIITLPLVVRYVNNLFGVFMNVNKNL